MYIENNLLVELWGERALFTRPELKAERYSYDVITPSAARNILQSIYWHPGFDFVLDGIYLLPKYGESNTEENPIQKISVKRNEVGTKISASNIRNGVETYIDAEDAIQQRNSVLLKDVHYVIQAHIQMNQNGNDSDNLLKFLEIFSRRCQKGQCFSQPYFGCREFHCNFALWNKEKKIPAVHLDRDFGLMLFDMEYPSPDKKGSRKPATPMFFHAVMYQGFINLKNTEIYR